MAVLYGEFRTHDVDGQKAAVRGVGIVFGAVAVEHHVALAKDGAVTFDQLALQDQELLMPVVAVPARGHACGHPVDVKARPQRLIVVQLQDFVAQGQTIVIDKGREGGVVNIGDLAVIGVDRLHYGLRQSEGFSCSVTVVAVNFTAFEQGQKHRGS